MLLGENINYIGNTRKIKLRICSMHNKYCQYRSIKRVVWICFQIILRGKINYLQILWKMASTICSLFVFTCRLLLKKI
jgi:hypothetical protein